MVPALSVNIYTAKVGKGYICVMLSTEQRSFTQSIYSSFSSFQSWPKLQCLNPERMVRNLQLYKQTEIKLIQVNIFQKHLILHQLTHIMTKDCSFNYEFITWKLQACCVHKIFCFVLTLRTTYAHNIYWTYKSMNNLLLYWVDARIRASNKDVPVTKYYRPSLIQKLFRLLFNQQKKV